MNDWVKILLPIGISLLLAFFGYLLNAGRVANCQATNETRGIIREILLTVPDLEGRDEEVFLTRSLELLEARDCSLL